MMSAEDAFAETNPNSFACIGKDGCSACQCLIALNADIDVAGVGFGAVADAPAGLGSDQGRAGDRE